MRQLRRRRVWRSALGLFVAAVVLVPATGVLAGPFGSTTCNGLPRNCISLAFDSDVTYRWAGTIGNQVPGIGAAVNYTAQNQYNPTDLYYKPLSGTIDVIIGDADYPQYVSKAAWVECPVGATQGSAGNPLRWCIGQRIRFNGSAPGSGSYSTFELRHLACHEMGHTVGLQHYTTTSSCMSPSTTWTSAQLNAADRANINNWY